MFYTCYVPPEVWFVQGEDLEQAQRERDRISRYATFARIPSFFRKEAEVLVGSSLQQQALREQSGGDWYFTDGRTDLKKKLPLRRRFVSDRRGETDVQLVPAGERRPLAPKDRHLFLTFAELPLLSLATSDCNAIEAFITCYGFLGGELTRYMRSPEDEEASDLVVGETYMDWASEVLELRYAVGLWRSLTAKDPAPLERFVSWEEAASDEGTYVSRLTKPREAWFEEEAVILNLRSERWLTWPLSVPDAERVWTDAPDRNETLKAGWHFLTSWINQGLVGRTATQLAVVPQTDQLGLTPTPTCLIGALWQQFANAVVSSEDLHICPSCGGGFPIRRTVDSRSDKTYCSDRCRQRAHRLRNRSTPHQGSPA